MKLHISEISVKFLRINITNQKQIIKHHDLPTFAFDVSKKKPQKKSEKENKKNNDDS